MSEKLEKKLSVLWVGSSSTNDQIINYTDAMLEEAGYDVNSVKADAYFSIWKKDIDAENEILKEKYDKTILQFSTWFLKYSEDEAKEAIKDAYELAKHLCGIIRNNDSEPIIFEHYVSGEITGMQIEASNVIRDVAKQNDSTIAYCGSAFIEALNQNDQQEEYFPELLMDDRTHAGNIGNYIMSCSMFIAITGMSPVGLKFRQLDDEDSEISDEMAIKLQEIAWSKYKT